MFDKRTLISKLGIRIPEYYLNRERLERFLSKDIRRHGTKLTISEFNPIRGYGGTAMVIIGTGFSNIRHENHVTVAGYPATVVESESNRLLVLTDPKTDTGVVEVNVKGQVVRGPCDFIQIPWPEPGAGEDGPPYSFTGIGFPGSASAGTIPTTGVVQIIVVPTYPTDSIPPNLATERQNIVDTFNDVTEFYDQVSYGTLDVQVDVTNWIPLLDNSAHYHRANGAPSYPNIDNAVLDQLMAEAAQGAVDDGFNLDNYVLMATLIYLPGLGVRAWGGWSSSNFAYNDGAGTNISITTAQALGLIAARHDADWGRAAHELAHNLVDGGLVLGEDVYRSDLVDPNEATATQFDMMGSHDSHPLFSGFYMDQLGHYNNNNILTLQWDRNPFSGEYDLVAHGLTQNTQANRYHLIRLKVSPGLEYYIEVRQRPDTTAANPQVFDENIPIPAGSPADGGVIVTKAISGELNNNQQTRLITLLHDPITLQTGDTAIDPLRDLRITVVNDNVVNRPLVAHVRVEWAQQIADTPGGDFDLRIEPWGPGWETEDIWIDRIPYGTYDFVDPSNNPTGNGDEPRPMEINRFYARVHNDGAIDANNVRVTFYVITPPGVGDNGTWTPLQTETYGTIVANNFIEEYTEWVPLVGEHTCLKVAIEAQLGEVNVGNNAAQENVFNFQPPASSVPDPISMTVAIRNPLEERTLIRLHVDGVPEGFRVYVPHRWVWLEALGERKIDMIVVPTKDIREMEMRQANIRVYGTVAHGYSEKVEITGVPASWMASIGGIMAQVHPKLRGSIELREDEERTNEHVLAVEGFVEPELGGQKLRVDITYPDGTVDAHFAETNEQGHFRTSFELEERFLKEIQEVEFSSDRLMRQQLKMARRVGERKVQMIFTVQAHIFNAKDIAPTDSNIVRFYR